MRGRQASRGPAPLSRRCRLCERWAQRNGLCYTCYRLASTKSSRALDDDAARGRLVERADKLEAMRGPGDLHAPRPDKEIVVGGVAYRVTWDGA